MLKIRKYFATTCDQISLVIKRDLRSISEQKIAICDVNINYVKSGGGDKSILLMPGVLGSAWTDFQPQIEHLPKLLKNHTIYAWDPPGYGKSIPPNRKFDLEFFRRDAELANKLMCKLGINKYSILGWSDGGITAMICAAYYTNSIEQLVIWGANAYLTAVELANLEKMRNLSTWSEKIKQPLVDLYGKEYFEKCWHEWIDCMTRFLNEQNGDICKNEIKEIACKTLILHGDKDPMIAKEHVPYLMEHIQRAQLQRYPEGKHNIHLRYADEFNKTVAYFLS